MATCDEDIVLVDPPFATIEVVPPERLLDAHRDERQFGGTSGLRKGPAFSEAELARIKTLVLERLLYAAEAFSPQAAQDLQAVGLEAYHTVSDRMDHARMLSKAGRILSGEAVDEIKRMSFFNYVRDAFGPFKLADEDGVGHEQVCIRLVRPGRREDVGSLHRDSWFWDHYGWPIETGVGRAKVWTGICVDAAKNGLLLAPGSHLASYGHSVEVCGGKVAFVPQFDWRDIGLRRFDGRPGDPVFFNYRTLHVGSLNRAETCRVSIETTILYRESEGVRSRA